MQAALEQARQNIPARDFSQALVLACLVIAFTVSYSSPVSRLRRPFLSRGCEEINNLSQRRQGAKGRRGEPLCFRCALGDFAPCLRRQVLRDTVFSFPGSSMSVERASVMPFADPWPEIRTARLRLRRWRADDREAFAALNSDPLVMEHFPAALSRAESNALADRIEAHFTQHGFGLWAVEIPGSVEFAGFLGLSIPSFQVHFTPCVEIGWRLRRDGWGKGYATEGARAALRFGFERLGLEEIVSFTVPANLRSRRVMERIGMQHSPADDFDHPLLPAGHPLRRHVLYRRARAGWEIL